jgi:hypothetical protein
MSEASCDGDEERVLVSAPSHSLGEVTVTLLDHHGDPVTQPLTTRVGTEPTLFTFHTSKALAGAAHGIEGTHVWIHDLSASGAGTAHARGDVTYGLRVYTSDGEFGQAAPVKRAFVPLVRMAPTGAGHSRFGLGPMGP